MQSVQVTSVVFKENSLTRVFEMGHRMVGVTDAWGVWADGRTHELRHRVTTARNKVTFIQKGTKRFDEMYWW